MTYAHPTSHSTHVPWWQRTQEPYDGGSFRVDSYAQGEVPFTEQLAAVSIADRADLTDPTWWRFAKRAPARVLFCLVYPFALVFVLLGMLPRICAFVDLLAGSLITSLAWVLYADTQSVAKTIAFVGAALVLRVVLWLAKLYDRYEATRIAKANGWHEQFEGPYHVSSSRSTGNWPSEF